MDLRGVCGGDLRKRPTRHRETLGPKKKTEKQHIMAGWSFHPACFYHLKVLKTPAPACPSLPHNNRSVRSAGCRSTPNPKPSISKAGKEKSPAGPRSSSRPRALSLEAFFSARERFSRPWKTSLARISSARRNRPREHIFRGTWGKPACPHKCARWPRQTEALRRGWSSCPASVLRSPAPYPAEPAP